MPASLLLLPSFLAVVAPLRACFPRRRTFENFVAVLIGWVLAQATGTVSSALVAGDLVHVKHWSAFYRLFSRAPWCIDRLGLAVADLLVSRFALQGPLAVAVDDTLHAKGGPHVFGAGMHHDPLTSTRARAQFQFGHCWVTLALVVTLPFDRRPRALPVLFRLNMPKKMAAKWGVPHRKKTEQAVEVLKLFAEHFPDRHIRLVNDNLYSCETLLQHLPPNVEMVGRLNLEAALYGPVAPRAGRRKGRPSKWGQKLPTPRGVAQDASSWEERRVHIYGRDVTVRLKTFTAYWRSAGPHRPIRGVVVWRPHGRYPYEAFFSTEADLSVTDVLEIYACRWSLEVTFHETRASLGADRPQGWTRNAALRTAPVAMLLYGLVVLWYADYGRASPAATWPVRPWYPPKRTASFEDMVATLRRAILLPGLSGEAEPARDPEKVHAGLLRWFRAAA